MLENQLPAQAPSTVTDTKPGGADPPPERDVIHELGYQPELKRIRSMYTVLFQSLAIAAIPYSFGAPLLSAVYGGGQLPMLVGWIFVVLADECVALSLAELASRYPTSAGPYYWSFQLAPSRYRVGFSFLSGWIWLFGAWIGTLSANFGFASLIAACVTLFHKEITLQPWQLLLLFYVICGTTFLICAYGNHLLPRIDTVGAAFTVVTVLVTLICLSVQAKAGRRSVGETLVGYDPGLSGWKGFSYFIGILPASYTFCGLGMVSAMAEEVSRPETQLPRAMAWSIPMGGLVGLFFVIPLCATMPDPEYLIEAPVGQVLPYLYAAVTGSAMGGLALTILVLVVTFFCSVSVTVATSRCTWAFARDKALPLHQIWSKVDKRLGTTLWALVLTTVVQMLVSLINIGSSSAFLAFVSVGVISLAIANAIPIAISVCNGRNEVNSAPWTMGAAVGWPVNMVALLWTAFEVVLFSMPQTLPVTGASMNYGSTVFVGLLIFGGIYYATYGHRVYQGPPPSKGFLGSASE